MTSPLWGICGEGASIGPRAQAGPPPLSQVPTLPSATSGRPHRGWADPGAGRQSPREALVLRLQVRVGREACGFHRGGRVRRSIQEAIELLQPLRGAAPEGRTAPRLSRALDCPHLPCSLHPVLDRPDLRLAAIEAAKIGGGPLSSSGKALPMRRGEPRPTPSRVSSGRRRLFPPGEASRRFRRRTRFRCR